MANDNLSLAQTMKLSFPLVLAVVAVAHPFPVYALDCTKASLPLEKLFCATPELKRADEAMSAAYFKLLRETADPDFHEALIRSQRRWVEVRSHGVDRFGAAADDPNAQTDDRKVLLQMTRDRLTFLQTAEPIRRMKERQKIVSKDGGGPFAGYQPADCFFVPPPYGDWNYLCMGTTHRQHDRICSLTISWATGRTYEYRFVSVLKNGKPEPVASCTAYFVDMGERCPEPDDDDETKALSHWNINPKPSGDYLPAPRAGDLWKYDPDIEPDLTGQPWMNDCLTASTYPPPEVSRASSSPRE
jgi:uncharacterized protein YecT (DUF1311 family)